MSINEMQEIPFPRRSVSGLLDIEADIINVNTITTVTTTSGGAGAITPDVQRLSSFGTYNTPVGSRYLIVECMGGGGGGGCVNISNQCAGGGGGGAYFKKQYNSPAATYPFTVGGGGTGAPSGAKADGADGTASMFNNEFAAGGKGGKGLGLTTSGSGGLGGSTFTGLTGEIIRISGGMGGAGGGTTVSSTSFGGGGGFYNNSEVKHDASAATIGALPTAPGGGGAGCIGTATSPGTDGATGFITVIAYF
jgi:hypothetical protein